MTYYNPETKGQPIKILDEGIPLTGNLSSIDFTGAGVTGSVLGDAVTETIPGGGGGGTPGGNYATIQWNDNGAFGGDDKLKWLGNVETLEIASGKLQSDVVKSSAPIPELLSNPGFETWNSGLWLDSWSDIGGNNGGHSIYSPTRSSDAYVGTYSVEFNGGGDFNTISGVAQNLTGLTPSDDFNLYFRAKGTGKTITVVYSQDLQARVNSYWWDFVNGTWLNTSPNTTVDYSLEAWSGIIYEASDWTLYNPGIGPSDPNAPIRSTDKHTGSYAIQFQGGGDFSSVSLAIHQFSSLTPSDSYVAKVWAKTATAGDLNVVYQYNSGMDTYMYNFTGASAGTFTIAMGGPSPDQLYSFSLTNSYVQYTIPAVIVPAGGAFDMLLACTENNIVADDVTFDKGSGDICVNGDFETWIPTAGTLDDWAVLIPSGTAAVLPETDPTFVHSGTYSAKFTSNVGGSAYIHQTVVTGGTPGDYWRLDLWGKGAIGGEAIGAFFLNGGGDEIYNFNTQTWDSFTSGPPTVDQIWAIYGIMASWNNYDTSIKLPTDGSVDIYVGGGNGDTFYIDDINFYIDNQGPTNDCFGSISITSNTWDAYDTTGFDPVAAPATGKIDMIILSTDSGVLVDDASFVHGAGSSVLTDGSFENWSPYYTNPTDWDVGDYNNPGNNQGSINRETSIVHTPSTVSVQILNGNWDDKYIGQLVTSLTPATDYNVSVYARGTGGAEQLGFLLLNDTPASATQIWNWTNSVWDTIPFPPINLPVPPSVYVSQNNMTGSWANIIALAIPAPANVQMYPMFICIGQSNFIYIDDASLKIVGSGSPPITIWDFADPEVSANLDANDKVVDFHVSDKAYLEVDGIGHIKNSFGTYVSGSNTGDETQTTIKTKLGAASSITDGYLTSSDWTTFNSKGDVFGPGAVTSDNHIAVWNGGGGNSIKDSLVDISSIVTTASLLWKQANSPYPEFAELDTSKVTDIRLSENHPYTGTPGSASGIIRLLSSAYNLDTDIITHYNWNIQAQGVPGHGTYSALKFALATSDVLELRPTGAILTGKLAVNPTITGNYQTGGNVTLFSNHTGVVGIDSYMTLGNASVSNSAFKGTLYTVGGGGIGSNSADVFTAWISGHVDDAGAFYTGFDAQSFLKNGGTSTGYAFYVGTGWDCAFYSAGGKIHALYETTNTYQTAYEFDTNVFHSSSYPTKFNINLEDDVTGIRGIRGWIYSAHAITNGNTNGVFSCLITGNAGDNNAGYNGFSFESPNKMGGNSLMTAINLDTGWDYILNSANTTIKGDGRITGTFNPTADAQVGIHADGTSMHTSYAQFDGALTLGYDAQTNSVFKGFIAPNSAMGIEKENDVFTAKVFGNVGDTGASYRGFNATSFTNLGGTSTGIAYNIGTGWDYYIKGANFSVDSLGNIVSAGTLQATNGKFTTQTTNGFAKFINSDGTLGVQSVADAQQAIIGDILTATTSVDWSFIAGDHVSASVIPSGVDHNSLANLSTGDVHTQYVYAGSTLTLYVVTTGNDSNNGSSGTPFLTIQHALNVASRYQESGSITINIADGTYQENVVMPTAGTGNLTIQGNSTTPANVLWKATTTSNDCFTQVGASWVTMIRGVKFQDCRRCINIDRTRLILGEIQALNFQYGMFVNNKSIVTEIGTTGMVLDGTGGSSPTAIQCINGSEVQFLNRVVISNVLIGSFIQNFAKLTYSVGATISTLSGGNGVLVRYYSMFYNYSTSATTINGTGTKSGFGIQISNSMASMTAGSLITINNYGYGIVLDGMSSWSEGNTCTYSFTGNTKTVYVEQQAAFLSINSFSGATIEYFKDFAGGFTKTYGFDSRYVNNTNFRTYSAANYSAYPTLTRVSPYGVNASIATGNIGKTTAGTRDFFFPGQSDRIRQTGTITQLKFYVANALTNTSSITFRVWRYNGATYDQVAVSENVVSELTPSAMNTLTLSMPLAVQEGDFMGIQVVTTGTAAYQFTVTGSLTAGAHQWTYYDGGAGNTGFNWGGNTPTDSATIVIESYMIAPQVVFIGDSIMAGHPSNFSFVEATKTTALTSTIEYAFRALSSMSHQNMGIGSQTTTNISARFTTDVINLNPRIVVINGGVNDIAGAVITRATFLANWASMFAAAQTAGITVIAMAILPWTNGSDANMRIRDDWNQALKNLCAGYTNVFFIDLNSYVGQLRASTDANNLWDIRTAYNSDGVHLNAAGYAVVAQGIYDALLKTYVKADSIKAVTASPLYLSGNSADSIYATGVISENLTPLTGGNIHTFINDGKVQAKIDYAGAGYLSSLLTGATANFTDFSATKAVFSQADTGSTSTANIGAVGEGVAVNASVGGYGFVGYGKSAGNQSGVGMYASGLVSATGDTGGSYGIQAGATATHAGGSNVAVYGDASGGAYNYSFYGNSGWLYNLGNVGFGVSPSSSTGVTVGQSITASSGSANLLYMQGTLTAAANADYLLGGHIAYTNFAVGAYTGLALTGLYIEGDSFTKTGAGTIDFSAGLRVSAPTIGVNNYAIYSQSGLNYFGGQITGAAGINLGDTTLSNYKEGTFTPTITLVGGTGNTVPQYSTNTGRYTRIGNLVYVRILLTGITGNAGAGTGQLTIALPITVSASQPADYVIAGHFHNGAAERLAYVMPNASTLTASMFLQTSATQTSAAQGVDQNSGSDRSMSFDFFYEV